MDPPSAPLPVPVAAVAAQSDRRRSGEQRHRQHSSQARTAESVLHGRAGAREAQHVPRVRRATKPTYGTKQRRLEGKSQRAQIKAGRGKVAGE